MIPGATAPTPDALRCVELQHQLDAALARIAQLEAQVHELLLRLQQNSSNSSIPPSANPPHAPKPPAKPPTGRKPGGQPGHRGHHRHRLPPERVDRFEHYHPEVCGGCQATLPRQPGPDDPPPSWHQVAELPVTAAIVTEHRAHCRTCPGCGRLNHATIPAQVRSHVIGPRLAAVMSYLSGRFHLSKRSVGELVEALFDAPVSLGTVATLEQQTSQALAAAHQQAGQAVQHAVVRNADETSWKQAGATRWLWTAATALVAYFVIHTRRGAVGLQALLGEAITGVVISDRWWGYNKLPLDQRQICWAHLKRDFRKCGDRGGEGKVVGDIGLAVVEDIFALWWEFRRGQIDRATMQRQMDPAVRELLGALQRGSGCADAKVRGFCDNLVKLYPALWLFAAMEGVEPTNNHAERMLRAGVLWRKTSFGSHSESGCRFAERMLTVVQTLRLQKRSVVDFLERSVVAHRSGTPAPALLMPYRD